MNDENGGNDEDGEDHCDEINRDTEAERIGSNIAKRMRLINELKRLELEIKKLKLSINTWH